MRNRRFSWLFLAAICSIFNNVVFGQCPEDQQSLLLELKKNLMISSPLSTKLVRWNETVDYCDWKGVSCHDGCVIGLDLSQEYIIGSPNLSSLFSLRFLQNLNFAFNLFSSTIPSAFERLPNLKVLNMSRAGFQGQIPSGISRLTKLVTLDLTTVSFLQPLKLGNPNFETLIQNLNNLRELYLDGVDLSAGGNNWCKALSSSLPNLRVLSLSMCSLSVPIDSSLRKLRSLSVIRLDYNNFSSPVPDIFAEFSNLTSLHLGSSSLSGLFPESIFQVSTLQILDLSTNRLLQGSLPDFQLNRSLRMLALRGTNFSGKLPDSIGRLEGLTTLDLANCNFGGLIPNSIANLRLLSYLDFSNNKFLGTIPSFSSLKNLTLVSLGHNKLSGSILSTKWEELINLVNLDLCNNSLSGSIPFSLFRLQSIQRIQLCYNQFSGSFNKLSHVSAFLLNTLALERNQLGGPFPFLFFKFRGLMSLTLSFNNFTGTLNLNMIMQLKNLSQLELSSNNLSVETDNPDSNPTFSAFPQMNTLKLASCKLKRFPGFLKNQSKLSTLDLSNNELQGEIPLWSWGNQLFQLNLSCNSLSGFKGSLQNLSMLFILDLHSNKFNGPIPFLPPFTAYLDFSNNSFSSAIPPDVGYFPSNIFFFSLSRNNIEGSIPESICESKYLQLLDLSHNNLSGAFPQCLTKMAENLTVLNLRENNLEGSIPNTFPVKCGLRTLDVSGNDIGGQLPPSLSNCQVLEVLNVGNNRISDVFPSALKNISTLRVLVLRSNKFYGNIRCQDSKGIWPSLQIVDLARNNFHGHIPGKCLLNWIAMVEDEKDSHSKFDHLRVDILGFVNYRDTVTITTKGREFDLTKILTIFTAVDFSCNYFHGHIPAEIGELRALYILNLSHNSLSGEIPLSIGNLRQMESFDLSWNSLTGGIPSQLGMLNFLSVLNLSYNRLVGVIPRSTQIQSFSPNSFIGNEGLCGEPSPNRCKIAPISPNTRISTAVSETKYDWHFISMVIFVGAGFGVGLGATVLVMFLGPGREWADEAVHKTLLAILPLTIGGCKRVNNCYMSIAQNCI